MAIMGNAELAMDGVEPGTNLAQDLAQIKATARRAADLTAKLLIYTGRGPVSASRLSLSSLAETLRPHLASLLPPRVRLYLELDSKLPAIAADPAAIRLALSALVVNAAEAMGEGGGEINLTTSSMKCGRRFLERTYLGSLAAEGEYVCLEVSDDGAGMDAETRQRMFDPFFSTKFTGRGLGLSAVLGMLRSHHGTVEVRSAPGQGTHVRLLLPADGGRARRKKESAAKPTLGKVLLADDDAQVLNVTTRMLASAGYEVITAADGVEAVERFQALHRGLGLVLLDLAMPRMNGGQAFARMQEIDAEVPVMIYSGNSIDEVAARLPAGDLAGYLQKPFDRSTLCQAVARHLRKLDRVPRP